MTGASGTTKPDAGDATSFGNGNRNQQQQRAPCTAFRASSLVPSQRGARDEQQILAR